MPYRIEEFEHRPHIIPDATSTSAGVMSAADKAKLDSIIPATGVVHAQQFFVDVSTAARTVIYVRPTGSDSKGDGKTPATAFRTVQFALNTIPLEQRGVRYIVDITGINDNEQAITVPPYINSDPIVFVTNPPLNPAFNNEGYVTIEAQPTVLSSLNAGTTTVSNDASSGLATVTDTSQHWTVNQFIGKFVVGSGLFEFGTIYKNTATALSVASGSTTFTSPVKVYDVGATLTGSAINPANTISMSGVQAAIGIYGVSIQNPIAYTPAIFGDPFNTLNLTLVATNEPELGGTVFETNACFVQGEGGLAFTDSILRCVSITFGDSYIKGLTPEIVGASVQISGCVLDNTVFLNTNGGGSGAPINISSAQFLTQGLVLVGASCSASAKNIRVDNATVVANTNPNGSGIHVSGGATLALLQGAFGGAGNAGWGLEVDSGATVWMEDSAPITATITGTSGDLKVGTQATRTWNDFLNNAPKLTQIDVYSLSGFSTNNGAQVALSPLYPPFTDGTRPAPGSVKAGVAIYNTTHNIPNWSDGANWRNAAGGIV